MYSPNDHNIFIVSKDLKTAQKSILNGYFIA